MPSNTNIVGRICPYCAESILVDARICKYCNRYINDRSTVHAKNFHSIYSIKTINRKLMNVEKDLRKWKYAYFINNVALRIGRIYDNYSKETKFLLNILGVYLLVGGLCCLLFFAVLGDYSYIYSDDYLKVDAAYLAQVVKVIRVGISTAIIFSGVLILSRDKWLGMRQKEIEIFNDKSAPCLEHFGIYVNLVVTQSVFAVALIASIVTYDLFWSITSSILLVVICPLLYGGKYFLYGLLNGMIGLLYLVYYVLNMRHMALMAVLYDIDMLKYYPILSGKSLFIITIMFCIIFSQTSRLKIGRFRFGHIRGDLSTKIAGSTVIFPFTSSLILSLFWTSWEYRYLWSRLGYGW